MILRKKGSYGPLVNVKYILWFGRWLSLIPIPYVHVLMCWSVDPVCYFYFYFFREDETDVVFPKDECKPLSTLCPPAVPE